MRGTRKKLKLNSKPMKGLKNGGSVKTRAGKKLISDIAVALGKIEGWGSVEIFVQDHKVVQITARNIKKTKHDLNRKNRVLTRV